MYTICEAKFSQSHVAQILAATATRKDPIFTAPRKCVVREVSVVTQTAVTGNTTNTKNLNIVDVGAAGVGTTEIANLDLITSVNLTALDEVNIPLNATYLVPGRTMAAGDVLCLECEQVGTGVIVGPFLVKTLWAPLE